MNRITELALRAAAVRWYTLYKEKPVANDLFLTQAREAEAELVKNGKVGVPACYRATELKPGAQA